LKSKAVVIGTVRSYIAPEGFNLAGLKTEEAAEDILNLRKLVKNHVRLALIDKQLGAYLINTDMPQNKIEWLVTLQKIPLRNGFIKTAGSDWNKKLHDFNNGLAILQRKGIVEEILKKHHLSTD
jgi:hypothetical protein